MLSSHGILASGGSDAVWVANRFYWAAVSGADGRQRAGRDAVERRNSPVAGSRKGGTASGGTQRVEIEERGGKRRPFPLKGGPTC
jgi:hypothetical protein